MQREVTRSVTIAYRDWTLPKVVLVVVPVVVPGTNLDHIKMWARLGVKHPGTGEPSIGVRDILMFSMLINLLLLLLLLL